MSGAVGMLAPSYATGAVTINVVAGAPRLDLDGNVAGTGFTTTYTENGAARAVADTDVSITDSNSTNLTGATITLMNPQTGDQLLAGSMPAGITATVSGNVVTLSGTATLASYQTALEAVTFQNTTENPSTTARTVQVVVTDGTSNSNTAVATINVTAVNDAPVNAVPGSQTVYSGTPLAFSTANGNAISVADVEATTVQVTLAATNGTVTLSGTTGLSFTLGDGTADGTMTFSGTQAAVNAALAGASYTSTAGYSGAATLTVTTSDLGASGTGGTLTDVDAIAITVRSVNAVDDAGSMTEDAGVTVVAPGLLTNDAYVGSTVITGMLGNYVVSADSTSNDLWEDQAAAAPNLNWDFGTGTATKNESGHELPGNHQSYPFDAVNNARRRPGHLLRR
jgi:hypothetical protein